MNDLEQTKKLAQQNINQLTKEIKMWESILTTITSSEVANVVSNINISHANAGQVSNEINQNLNVQKIHIENYNAGMSVEEKAMIYASTINRAFSFNDIKGFILEKEGPEAGILSTVGLSQKLKYLLKGKFIAAKFDDNKFYYYYLLREWLTEDGSDIQEKYYPSSATFGTLPLTHRNKQHIHWITK